MKRNKTRLLRRTADFLIAVIVPVLLLVLWEYCAKYGYIKVTLMPPPTKIARVLWNLIQKGTLQKNIMISLKRVVSGYLLGAAMGIVVGVAMGLFPLVKKLFSFLTNILRPIPMLAWIPVFILWLGIGEITKIAVIALGTFWPVLINVVDGIESVDQKYLEVSTVFCKNKAEQIKDIIIPASLPSMVTGLRLASGNALMSVIAAEMFAASAGLGFMISNAREMAQADKMLGGVFVIGLFGWILNYLVMHLNRRQKHG